MAGDNTIRIKIVGDESDFKRALDDSAKSTDKFGSKMSKLGKTAAVAGVAGFGALFGVVKVGFDELKGAQEVTAQTEAVIKSTGGSANVTAKQVDELASALSRKSGVDDEVIASGENLLLTFTNIRNEAGKGNDIFNQATTIANDMSVALGQDMKSSAIQLGKALNDPIKGITALSRVGVSFTAQQKEQITALVKSGDTMKAQKLILAELNKEFGGSAEAAGNTLSGQLNKAKNSFEELSASIVTLLVPALTTVANWVSTVSTYLQEHETVAKALFITIGTLSGVLIAAGVATKLYAAYQVIVQGATAAWTAAQWLLNAALSANPIGLIIVAVAGLVAGIIVAYRESETFRNIVQGALNAVKTAAEVVANFFKQNVVPAIRAIINVAQDLWNYFNNNLLPIFQMAFNVAKKLADFYKDYVVLQFNLVKTTVQVLIGVIRTLVNVIEDVWGAAKKVADFLVNGFTNALELGKKALGTAANFIKGTITPVIDALGDAFNVIVVALKYIINSGLEVFKKLWNGSKDFLSRLAGALAPVGDAIGAISGGISGIIDKAEDFVNAIGKIAGAAGKVGGLIGKLPGLASGGPVVAGQAYIVGENGPELFVAGQSGNIVPNHALSSAVPSSISSSGGMGTLVVNVNAGTFIGTDKYRAAQELTELIRPELYKLQSRNGTTGLT